MGNLDSAFMEYGPELEEFEYDEEEWEGEGEAFDEAELMELAGELLQVESEAELDQFLGKLIKKAARKVRRVVRSPIGRTVGGFLKSVAKKALPFAGAALGGVVGGPLGAKIGRGLAKCARGVLGFEAETLSEEDEEFEGAKQYVRLSGEAVKSALTAPTNINPTAVAQQAVAAAAAKHAPAIMGQVPAGGPMGLGGRSGRWVRKGRNIVLQNV
jgi:uncharacterized protein (DUF697 family)